MPLSRRPHPRADDLVADAAGHPAPRRTRLRRGGPRTPLPLLPLIGVLAGVGVAYVSQSAHSTQANYQAAALAQQNQRLRSQDAQLTDDLARLESTERIVAAAQRLGMRPAVHWSYVNAQLTPVITVPSPVLALRPADGDPLQRLVATVGGAVGIGGGAP